MDELLHRARKAFTDAPPLDDDRYRLLPSRVAAALVRAWPALIEANSQDIESAIGKGLPEAIVDRLRLGDAQLDQLLQLTGTVAAALEDVVAAGPSRPAGTWGSLRALPKPLGVLLMVYEARPTVTVEAALLACSVGNAVILRGGQELTATNSVMGRVLADALADAGLPPGLAQVLHDPDRAGLRALLQRPDAIDVLIPRGSPSLIEYCRRASTIPVIASGGGINHLYIDATAELTEAARIALDSKLGEPTACNTLEFALVEQSAYRPFLRALAEAAAQQHTPVALRVVGADVEAGQLGPLAGSAVTWHELKPRDLDREFADAHLGVVAVPDLDAAIAHITTHGTGHTEGIVSADPVAVRRFCSGVDAAAVVVNGSLRLHDGPTLGLGPELSISTGRLHVRGPLTLSHLVTRSWVIDAGGTLRARADAGRASASQNLAPKEPLNVH
jgi:glutamate-5-semialdehyde dehydrogenase